MSELAFFLDPSRCIGCQSCVQACQEALLSDERGVLGPAAIASLALFAVNGGLLLHALRFDRRVQRSAS